MAGFINAEIVSKVKATFQWNITKDEKPVGSWTVDLKSGAGSVYEGKAKDKADCTLTVRLVG